MASKSRKLTQSELIAEAVTRFGGDPMDWAFQCPACGDIAAGKDLREALEAHPRKNRDGGATSASDVLGQECIGRTLGALSKNGKYEGRGCDWCAYGLFSVPWTVTLPGGGTMGCFPLAPAPGGCGGAW